MVPRASPTRILVRAILASSLAVSHSHPSNASSVGQSPRSRGTLAECLLDADRRLGLDSGGEQVDAALEQLSRRVRDCGDLGKATRDPWAACIINVILGPGGVRPTAQMLEPEVHTVTGALNLGEGSCAAIVALVLAVSEPTGDPFEAIVLRNHVVLAASWRRDLYFEPFERGRQVTASEVLRPDRLPPGQAHRVRSREFLPFYLDNLGARLADAGQYDRAEQAFREALAYKPRSGRVEFNYGTFLLQRGRFAEAEPRLRTAIHLGWSDAAAWTNRGVALWKLDKLGKARRCFEKALRLEPGYVEATANLRALDAATLKK